MSVDRESGYRSPVAGAAVNRKAAPKGFAGTAARFVDHLHDRVRLAKNRGHFSNFGEQEIIERYIEILRIDRQRHAVVDIGAGDGVRKSNTYRLVLNDWRVIGIEGDGRNAARLVKAYRSHPRAFACLSKVTPSNVVDLLRAHYVEKDFGVLSLDIDGYDYWVLDELLSAFRPRLIVSEYNEKIPPPIKFVVTYTPDFQLGHHFFGYSLCKLKELLTKHSYVLLEIEFNNVFLAPAELEGAVATDIEEAYRKGYRDRPDRKAKFNANTNMEILHSLGPGEIVKYLDEFYEAYRGEYQIDYEGAS